MLKTLLLIAIVLVALVYFKVIKFNDSNVQGKISSTTEQVVKTTKSVVNQGATALQQVSN